jgi:rare lipoprotein A
MRVGIAHGLALVLAAASLGAAQGPNSSESGRKGATPAGPPTRQAAKKPSHTKPYQVGTASWYGSDFMGRATASGEPYNMYDLTAAHPSLPLGSLVRVTNLNNGRNVVVRVNDRGPVVDGRIIDLSYSAARALKFREQGIQRVRLDLVQPETVAMLRPVAY